MMSLPMTRFEKEDSPRFDKARRRSRYGLPRWLPLLLLLLIAIVGFWLIGLEEEGLRQKFQAHHGHLLAFVREKPLWAAGGYLAAYAIAVAFSLPLASLMTLMGVISSAPSPARCWRYAQRRVERPAFFSSLAAPWRIAFRHAQEVTWLVCKRALDGVHLTTCSRFD